VLLFSLGVALSESNPPSPFLLFCVVDGPFPSGFKLPSVFQLFLVLFVSLGAASNESNLSSFLLCYVVDGLLPNGLGLLGDLLCVLEPPLVLLLSFGAPSSESNPPPLPFLLCC